MREKIDWTFPISFCSSRYLCIDLIVNILSSVNQVDEEELSISKSLLKSRSSSISNSMSSLFEILSFNRELLSSLNLIIISRGVVPPNS